MSTSIPPIVRPGDPETITVSISSHRARQKFERQFGRDVGFWRPDPRWLHYTDGQDYHVVRDTDREAIESITGIRVVKRVRAEQFHRRMGSQSHHSPEVST